MERKEIRYVEVGNEYRHLKAFITDFPVGKVCSIMLFGPPGTAKTTLAIRLAKDFGAEYEVVDGAEEIDRSNLEGVWTYKKEEGTVFVPGSLVKAILGANKNKIHFLIMNEPNAIRPTEQIGFNSLLSEGHVNLFSKAGERYEVEPDAKLVVIGTMNLKVLGVNELQEAFDDRFWMNKLMDYAPPHQEAQIIAEISGCKKEIAEIIVEVAQKFREAASPQQLSIPKVFSTRLGVNFAQMITIMKTKFLDENIRDMIVNKLAKEPAEIQTAKGILAGKDFKENLMVYLSNNYPGENELKITEEERVEMLDEIEEEEVVEVPAYVPVPTPVVPVAPVYPGLFTISQLNRWTRKEIKDYMRKNGIKNYSGKVKADLIKMILEHQEKVENLKKELSSF